MINYANTWYIHGVYRCSSIAMVFPQAPPRPLANSFDMARQLRQAASGHVTLHMAFSHWELSEDAFQRSPFTSPDFFGEGMMMYMDNCGCFIVVYHLYIAKFNL